MAVNTICRYLLCSFAVWVPLLSIEFDAVANDELAASEEIFWRSDYSRAMAEAHATGKPILIAFRCVP